MAVYQDDFNRSNSTGLGANWTDILNGFNVNTNVAKPRVADLNCTQYSAGSLGNNQYCKAVLGGYTGQSDVYIGVCCRLDASGNGYALFVSSNEAGFRISRLNAGANDDIATAAFTFVDGDVIELRVSGTTLSVYFNGTLYNSYTDSTYSSGKAGVFSYLANGSLDSWEAGDITSGVTITPSAGSLSVSGNAPVVTKQFKISPSAGSLTTTGNAARILGFIVPGAGSLAISGSQPSLAASPSIAPNAGSLALLGYAPAVIVPKTITPSVGALTFGGNQAQVSTTGNVVRQPSTAALTFTGNVSPQELGVPSPATLALVINGAAPQLTVSANSTRTPNAGAIVINGLAPSVTQQITIRPNAGALTLTGVAPLFGASANRTPVAGALSIQGLAPTVLVPVTVQPLAGSLSIAGQFSSTGGQANRTPAAGALGFTGNAPSLGTFGSIQVPTIALGITAYAPTVRQAAFRTPAVGALAFASTASTVQGNTNHTCTPDTGALIIGPIRGDRGAIRKPIRGSIRRAIRYSIRSL